MIKVTYVPICKIMTFLTVRYPVLLKLFVMVVGMAVSTGRRETGEPLGLISKAVGLEMTRSACRSCMGSGKIPARNRMVERDFAPQGWVMACLAT